MINYVQAIILGLLQGAAELFPVSSLGHSVILPSLFGWNLHQSDNSFLVFLVATHLATALVLIGFYRKTWLRISSGVIRSIQQREIKRTDHNAKLGWLLIVGTIPAGLIGIMFQDQIRMIFVTAQSAAFFLAINGLILLGAEYLRRRARPSEGDDAVGRLSRLSWLNSTMVGAAQALALIPVSYTH